MALIWRDLAGARFAFTDRFSLEAAHPETGFDVGVATGQSQADALANRCRLAKECGREVIWMEQTHSTDIVEVLPTAAVVEAAPARSGASVEYRAAGAPWHRAYCGDGLVAVRQKFVEANQPFPAVAVQVADCVPVLLSSIGGEVIGAIHAGRKGLVGGIIAAAIHKFSDLGISSDQICAAVGPAICGRCYEVPEQLRREVGEQYRAAWSLSRWGSAALDIRAGVIGELEKGGVEVAYLSQACTYEQEQYYSYRRQAHTGRNCGVIFTQTRHAETPAP